MKKIVMILGIILISGYTTLSGQKMVRITDYVDPFIGTGGHGHTYPGVSLPFGMVQLSPDTRLEGWDGCSGYHYSDSVIYGFSHTHLSGTGCSDYGDILLMPFIGEVSLSDYGYASFFRKETEKARPGYYRVMLDKNGIEVELTATLRTGFHRYTFPATGKAGIVIDLRHRDKVVTSWLRVTGPDEVEGFRQSTAWAKDQRVYFVAKFSKPFASFSIISDDETRKSSVEPNPGEIISRFNFIVHANEQILVKVGISAVST